MVQEIECELLRVRSEAIVDPKLANADKLSPMKGMKKSNRNYSNDDTSVTSVSCSSGSYEVQVIDFSSDEDELAKSISSHSNDEMQDNLSDSNKIILQELLDAAPSLDSKYFGQPSGESFRIRGQNYLKDKKKD